MSDLQQPGISARLRALTPARVGLARSGVSQMTRDVLDFQLCHAQARDAVHSSLDADALAATLSTLPNAPRHTALIRLHSAAPDRRTYLQRPDLGRRLNEQGSGALRMYGNARFDIAVIVCDGLSALAVERHVPGLLEQFLPRITDRSIAPICIVEQGRVAIGDEIGEALHAKLAVVLIGERPGLSSPDSLGAYITWAPRLGRTDAERICISNIRIEGLGYADAAEQLERVIAEAFVKQLTGVALAPAPPQLKGKP